MTYNFILLLCILSTVHISAQDCQTTSFGNSFVHNKGESVTFGLHDFQNGGMGTLPGIVGTERELDRGIFSFSDVSPGWQNADDDSHIDGYVKTYGSSAFTFPIGDNGKYRPAAITGGAGTTAAYYNADPSFARTSSLFGGDLSPLPVGAPFSRFSIDPIMDKVSDNEYWDINGQEPTQITLTWDADSDVTNLTDANIRNLTIVGWNGESWDVIPSTIDLLYLSVDRSDPFFFGGISSLTVGSITTDESFAPDDYEVYTLGSLALAIIGDRVWEDLNRNGIQDQGEPGLPGIDVYLDDASGFIIDQTVSNLNGNYYFTHVEPGSYRLRFNTPQDYSITLPGQGLRALDSDISFSGVSQVLNIFGDEVEYTIDAGFYKTASIGNYVWADFNKNGIQDEIGSGIGDVKVELLNESENILASTLTNDNGFYEFTNLPPGDYIIRFVAPEGLEFSPVYASPDETIDSDAHPITGQSRLFSVISGEQQMDIDAGFSSPCAFFGEIVKTTEFCDRGDGAAEIIITGTSGPYTYQWNNGATTPATTGLSAGTNQVIVTDIENCQTVFKFIVDEDENCPLVCVELQTAVNLEGAYNYDNQNMDIKLNELGYLPGQIPVTFFGTYTQPGQPYNRTPWDHMGLEGEDFLITTKAANNDFYPIDAVDWVLVSLRSEIDNEYETCTRAGLLMQDGSIQFDPDDCCMVDTTLSYHVVIEHRNHLIVMSPEAIQPQDSLLAYDFRSNQSYTKLLGYGQKEITPDVFAMYAANGDQSNEGSSPVDINVSDLAEWLKENGFHSSYYFMDFDLNGDANVQDKGLYLENIGIFTDVPKN